MRGTKQVSHVARTACSGGEGGWRAAIAVLRRPPQQHHYHRGRRSDDGWRGEVAAWGSSGTQSSPTLPPHSSPEAVPMSAAHPPPPQAPLPPPLTPLPPTRPPATSVDTKFDTVKGRHRHSTTGLERLRRRGGGSPSPCDKHTLPPPVAGYERAKRPPAASTRIEAGTPLPVPAHPQCPRPPPAPLPARFPAATRGRPALALCGRVGVSSPPPSRTFSRDGDQIRHPPTPRISGGGHPQPPHGGVYPRHGVEPPDQPVTGGEEAAHATCGTVGGHRRRRDRRGCGHRVRDKQHRWSGICRDPCILLIWG